MDQELEASTAILPTQSRGEDSHGDHALSAQLDPQVPILFLLRVGAVSIPETQTDFSLALSQWVSLPVDTL